MIGFDGWQNVGHFTGGVFYEPAELMTPALAEVFGAYADEHPLVVPVVIEKCPAPMKISDVLTSQQFHRTGLFNEVYKFMGADEQMCLGLEVMPNQVVSCTLNRERRDFTERDRAMLGALKPHLINAFRNAYALEQLEREREYLAEVADKGVLVLDREANLRFASEAALRLLQKYFEKFKDGKLPGDLRDFVKDQLRQVSEEYFEPSAPFHVSNENSELRIRLIFDLDRDELRLILEESEKLSPYIFRDVGFTTRESEVLYWIQMGKTNDVIATLCGCSTRTVQKHVEHIREKLNVETRTAAVRSALELLQGGKTLSGNSH
jgi:DNA-binding CsgD family transcriptional regulator